MTEFVNVSALIPDHPGLHVCLSDTAPVQVLQWQCKGEPFADKQRGVYSGSPAHLQKAESFIDLAKETRAHLVITPEYSFPDEILNKIVHEPTLWPAKGALWCLGMEGYSLHEFSKRMDEWERTGRTLVKRNAFIRLTQQSFVDVLVYLFLIDDDTLCILPQFKTVPMSEPWNDYEVPGLCKGEVIYIFDLSGCKADQNRFLSLICSDALSISPQQFLDKTQGKHLTIFHAQLNPNPRHPGFRSFRSGLFDQYAGRDIRLITLNWAAGTKIEGMPFNKPWSAFYKKSTDGAVVKKDLRVKNLDKGTFYALHRHTEIWYSHREDHCKIFDINKGFEVGVSHTLTAHHEPITQSSYNFDESSRKWISGLCNPSYSIQDLVESIGEDYDFPLYADAHDCDAFFGLCFGHFLEGELRADDDEVVTRMMFGSDSEADTKRRRKAGQYKRLIRVLQRQRFPQEFMELANNHRFYIDSETAESTSKYGNVYPKDRPLHELNPFHSILCIISDYTNSFDVEKQVNGIIQQLHSNFHHKLVVYYQPDEWDEYTYFDLSQTRIDKATLTKTMSSIKE
ncbi:hypothetical protein [Paenibacillus harenae]|uniref:Uncharacterized protein n=1 Tax=Paenibacillus harenae TaxID=306543 RepID=A0ABT9U6X4_PAEHA|nr:hypothetical protein [Paenibacillus harenae]MDQ0114194.1 hypothetical protein [Paenibacillus harenae]